MTVLRPKTRLADRYDLLEPLSASPLGEVWRAEDLQLSRQVAVLTVDRGLAADAGFRATFEAEARAWASVCHPGTTWVFDFGHVGGEAGAPPVVYLVRELVEGERLDAVLDRLGTLGVAQTLDIVAQAASTLAAAHSRGIVHGELTPTNLILRGDGVLKITNFGVARAVDATPLTSAHVALYGASYRSPEQAAGESPTPASDVYGLGVVAYECLTGQSPFRAEGPVGVALSHMTESPAPLPATVPDDAADLVYRMLDKEPDRRPWDAGVLVAEAVALCTALGGTPSRPPRELLGGDTSRLL